jgi:hypothetical protein
MKKMSRIAILFGSFLKFYPGIGYAPDQVNGKPNFCINLRFDKSSIKLYRTRVSFVPQDKLCQSRQIELLQPGS